MYVGSFRFTHEFYTAVKWLESGDINPLPLLSHTFAFTQAEEALKMASDKTQSIKVQLNFEVEK